MDSKQAIAEFAKLLLDRDYSDLVVSTQDLPVPQQEMLGILLEAYKTSEDQEYRDIIGSCIIHLSEFVPPEDYQIWTRWLELSKKMAEGDFSALEEFKQLSEESQRILDQTKQTMETYNNLIQRIDIER